MGHPHQFFPESVTVQKAVIPFNPNMSQLSQTSTGNNALFLHQIIIKKQTVQQTIIHPSNTNMINLICHSSFC